MSQSTRQIGASAEDLACEYLKRLGWKILKRNFFIRGGEIDIICDDHGTLAFVEVKARYSHKYGLPIESITPWKLKYLIRAAKFYVHQNHLDNMGMRIDLVGIDYSEDKTKPKIELIKNIT